MNADCSETLISEALKLFDQADDIERQIRAGATVPLDSGEILRGESALPRLDAIRESTMLPLLASAAINLHRIADALEAGGGRGRLDFDEVADSELVAELARRHYPNGLPR